MSRSEGRRRMPEEIPPPPWRRPKKAPPRVPLTQDRIVVTALGILDAEGLDALSMRRLAQELKTGHASLYAHVGNRDELLDLVFDIVLTEVEVPEPEPGRWAEQVKEMCRSLRRMFLAHRDLARIAIDRVPLGPNGMVGMERTMNLLRSGGLHDELAAYGGDLLSTFVTAEALEQSSRNPGTEQGREQAGVFADQLHGYLKSLPATSFPNLVHLAGPITSLDSDRRFELGLEIIIAGLLAGAGEAADDQVRTAGSPPAES
ncbi:TetR family transcriptional regulator ActII [Streptomyces lividans]|uniref:TetR family transcriptional regulator ActII n=1 Tax=Streptomyces TaxID=1883 RepID=UPI00099BB479|nr:MULTISPECIES: TetR family transcriptional regulator ActII [Streptomyces]WSB66083.1 TetR family transcriptional regulator ActII [Streptomyces anthocyanicus]